MNFKNTNKYEVFENKFLSSLRQVIGKNKANLHEPVFIGKEKEYLNDCVNSTFVSSVGKYVNIFEELITGYTKAKHAIAIVNGTSALHLALLIAGVKKNEEVLAPALTFVGTIAPISYSNAIPHFIDSGEKTLGIDPESLISWLKFSTELVNGFCVNKKTKRLIRAIIPMHTFGHPCDMDKITEIAKLYNLIIIEDAAESLGSWYKGYHTGTMGLMGILSFNGNKTITTGGGGAIITNDDAVAEKVRHISTTAKLQHKWDFIHNEIGYNYRMPNINAALGCAQIENILTFLKSKRNLFNNYQKVFKDFEEFELIEEPINCKSNYWLQTLKFKKEFEIYRDRVLQTTNDLGIITRPVWKLMTSLEPYIDCPSAPINNAIKLEKSLINIPSNLVSS